MRPPFPYYGSKGRLASQIALLLPPHRVYVEPFAGSAAVLFAKTQSEYELLNDKDRNVVTFFRVLREYPAALQRLCQLSPYARDEFAACDLSDDEVADLERARRFFVCATQSYNSNGTNPGRASWAPAIRQHTSKAHSAQRRADQLHALAGRLRSVAIENKPAIEVIETFDDPAAVHYVDPPYLGTTRSSLGQASKRARDYAHDMTSESEHAELAACLQRCRGTVLLSGYSSALYDQLYSGWYSADIEVSRPSANRRGEAGGRGVETIWSNRPLALQASLLDDGLDQLAAAA